MREFEEEDLRHLIRAAHDEPLQAPPPELWDRIAAATGLEPAVTANRARRSVSLPTAIAAAAACIAITAFVVNRFIDDPGTRTRTTAARSVSTNSNSNGNGGKVKVVSTVRLNPLNASKASATAKLEVAGTRSEPRLEVAAKGLKAARGSYYEVWMIDTRISKLVSLGPVRADGTYTLPVGFDPEKYPVVDVSEERLDGNPSHSGVSILRGTLRFSDQTRA